LRSKRGVLLTKIPRLKITAAILFAATIDHSSPPEPKSDIHRVGFQAPAIFLQNYAHDKTGRAGSPLPAERMD